MQRDFQGTAPAPRIARRHEPYEPIEADESRIPEMREGARIERDRNAKVQAYLAERRKRNAERAARGPLIRPAVWPKLPTADEAQHAIERARQKLFIAVAARDTAQEARDAAQRAVQAGSEAADKLAATLAAADGIDGEIATFQAAAIRAGEPSDVLPAALSERRQARDALRQQADDARAAADLLARDRDRAQQALVEAQGRVDTCIAAVLDAVSERIAGDMLAAQRRASELRARLHAAGAVSIGGKSYRLTAAAMQSLRDHDALMQNIGAGDAGRWREVIAALGVNADALLEIGD